MAMEPLTLVVNPGSASRKYALFKGNSQVAGLHFEFENTSVICTVTVGSESFTDTTSLNDLHDAVTQIVPLLKKHDVIEDEKAIGCIGIRVVAPSSAFLSDRLVDDEAIAQLEALQHRAPLHISVALAEIRRLHEFFASIPLVIISDSSFHADKPDLAWNYGLSLDLADRLEIKRFGYHGVSMGSVVNILENAHLLKEKAVICHLGSGSSLTAVLNGKGIDNTMGYSPLEGLLMATRTGNIDVSAALAVKRELNLSDDELESYLNKKSGLLGVSGISDDIRVLLEHEVKGDYRAGLALRLYVYRVQQLIAQMTAALQGVDMLVFTATVGQRSAIIRRRVVEGLGYLGFKLDSVVNDATLNPKEVIAVSAADSKLVIVVPTDEATEIAARARKLADSTKTA